VIGLTKQCRGTVDEMLLLEGNSILWTFCKMQTYGDVGVTLRYS